MKAGLFEVLRGRFSDGTPLESTEEQQHRIRSVIDNLNRLFNIRQGGISHLPDYGLPNMSEIYRDAPETIEVLRGAIKETVEKYEPRIQRVRVKQQPSDAHVGRLVFLLTGELVGGDRVEFETTFAEQVRVNQARRQR
jgi:type VI secretion system protein